MATPMDWPPAALHETKRISGLTHEFYRYPATTSPLLVREIIEEFSRPGDVVLDPFVGGGTTVVEALALGRRAVGFDINPLALTITRAKTTPLTGPEWIELDSWVEARPFEASCGLGAHDSRAANFPSELRGPFANALGSLRGLRTPQSRTLARCALLAAGKRAVETTRDTPEPIDLHAHLEARVAGMKVGMESLVASAAEHGLAKSRVRQSRTLLLGDVSRSDLRIDSPKTKLILTSPPYPGVHVLYHRWQVAGRRETAAAYWVARRRDGAGASYYTLGGRSERGQQQYFERITQAFARLRDLLTPDAVVVQIVGFHETGEQLPQYLEAMSAAGYSSAFPNADLAARTVPNRRWYNATRQNDSATEVVLAHRIAG